MIAWRDRGPIEWHHVSGCMRSAVMKVHRRPRFQHSVGVWEKFYPYVNTRGRGECSRIGKPVTAFDSAFLDTGDIECATFTSVTHFGGSILRVNAAHPHRYASRER